MEYTETNENMMTVLFRDRDNAEAAYKELLDRGFTRDQVSILMSDETRNRFYGKTTEMGNKAAEGLGVGAAVGGALGAITGAIVAIGTSVVLPGLGLVVAGPLAAALAGAGAGGAAGGLVGVLIGAGIPEETAKRYESGMEEGGVVLGFRPRSVVEANEVEKVWKDNDGEMIFR